MIDFNIFKNISQIPSREIISGFHGRMIHTEAMTLAFWEIEQGAKLPQHHHIHEQTSYVLEGKFEFTVNGETKVVEKGDFIVIGSNIPHHAQALTACTLIDIFTPCREDYM